MLKHLFHFILMNQSVFYNVAVDDLGKCGGEPGIWQE